MMITCQSCNKRARVTKYNRDGLCHPCYREHTEARLTANRAIVAGGKCPRCGEGLRRNLALTGWWQCAQYGAEQFRKDPTRPSCSFQTFAE
jgi:hypothetical protein